MTEHVTATTDETISMADHLRLMEAARNDALREAADRIDRKVKAHQPEMTRWGQALASGKKPNVNYAIQRAALDARISDRDMVLALIEGDTND